MPSKTLIYSAEVLHQLSRAVSSVLKTLILGRYGCDAAEEKGHNCRICGLSKGSTGGWAILFRSKAKFLDEHSVELEDGTVIEADKFLISTGSKISMPEVPGLNEVSFKTSDDVLDISEVPEEVVVLGGGIVACELAQFLSRVGARVTILQRNEHIIKEFPKSASNCVQEKFNEEGINVVTGVSIDCLTQNDKEIIRVDYQHDDEIHSIETKFLLHALGEFLQPMV